MKRTNTTGGKPIVVDESEYEYEEYYGTEQDEQEI